ncbi:L-rhamnose/proton symporter RhaT [Sphingomonas sp. RIT328]|uniref:L-rhamnose/proton symporter RhaT n=1 Tax=Sphingomonas sp. RIT328 TaxID=1470591 RepID=UPI00044A4914|nr:L-rhamnose/proton symporter RhaT [Sphingomonas sp. RIT328]EZP50452.1 RhaT l-rhamnose-proton symport 2 [Sphingomonas sp. RIT328]
MPNPLIGVVYHWLGGLSSASFYVPYRGVKGWRWEVLWLTGGLFSWLVAPWLFAALMTHDLLGVLMQVPGPTAGWCVLFGALWGFGGLTYGLTMRYLGLSMGMAVVLGLCTVFGTLIPPLFAGEFAAKLLDTVSGNIILLGILVTIAGIGAVALAGSRKNAALSDAEKLAGVAEFRFGRGLAVAVFSGVMSSCFAFGLAAGEPIRALSAAAGTGPLWTGLPVLCLVMFGGLVTNALWCGALILRNASVAQWLGRQGSAEAPRPPLMRNYLLAACGGMLWYLQFFFYTMGESQMGRLGFSSWTLHMASIIIFGTLWGFALREWTGTRRGIRMVVWTGIGLLVVATVIIGYGNSLV